MTEEIPESDREQYENQWDEIDEKTLLAQMLGELGAIRRELEYLNRVSASEGGGDEVSCNACGKTISREDRKRHAIREHNAPTDIPADDLPMFK